VQISFAAFAAKSSRYEEGEIFVQEIPFEVAQKGRRSAPVTGAA
jgi:hypothetical protein